MKSGIVFSEAFDENGEWVHVDDVLRGKDCNCFCPTCHEKLKACKGPHPEKRRHGFAHCSEKRGANLKICYYVNLYKRAESIIQEQKCIYAPSYYGIYDAKIIRFKDVQIDSRYEREDKQPDVIATTENEEQYLIEFVFRYKVQHKKALDYGNLTCLEVNLANQTFETLKDFLLSSCEDRKWLNNEVYFNQIETTYQKANKPVNLVPDESCQLCIINKTCVAVRDKGNLLIIENSGIKYRLCKTELYQNLIKEKELQESQKKEELRKWEEQRKIEQQRSDEEPSCYNCESNLSWGNRDGLAYCGGYISLNIPKFNKPEYAKQCKRYRHK